MMADAIADAFTKAGIPAEESAQYAQSLAAKGLDSLEAIGKANDEELTAAGVTLRGHMRLMTKAAQDATAAPASSTATTTTTTSVDEVVSALRESGLDAEAAQKCAQALSGEGFTTLAALSKIDENDIKACGITMRMHVKAILALKDGGGAPAGAAKKARVAEPLNTAPSAQPVQQLPDSDAPSHMSYVLSVAFSPDGQKVASGSYDDSIRLWTREGEELAVLRAHSKAVLGVAFSSSGLYLASASKDFTCKMWDVNTKEVKCTFNGHLNRVLCVTFAKNDTVLVSGSEDKTVIVWSVENAAVLRKLDGHQLAVTSVAVSSDDTLLASSSGDRTVRIWSMDSGETVRVLSKHSGGVQSVAFVKDKSWVVSGSKDETALLWDALSGVVLATFTGHAKWIDSVAVHGDCIATASGDNSIRLWDFSGKCIKILIGHLKDVRSVAFSPDGKTCVSGSDDRCVRLWKLDAAA